MKEICVIAKRERKKKTARLPVGAVITIVVLDMKIHNEK